MRKKYYSINIFKFFYNFFFTVELDKTNGERQESHSNSDSPKQLRHS
jgi:hypothetical protein